MKTFGVLLFCLGLFSAASDVRAGVAHKPSSKAPSAAFSQKYKDCMARVPSSDSELTGCEAEESDRLDKILNATYRELLPKLEADRRALLQKSERAWVSYRDVQCSYEQSRDAGRSLEAMDYYSCLKNMTSDRIKLLLEDWDD